MSTRSWALDQVNTRLCGFGSMLIGFHCGRTACWEVGGFRVNDLLVANK